MNTLVKGVIALLLLLGSIYCLQRFRAGYAGAELSRGVPAEVEANGTAAVPSVVETTNDTVLTTTSAESAGTNAPVAATAPPPAASLAKAPEAKPAQSKSFGWLGGFVGMMLVLAGLVAWEVAQWFSRRTGSVVFSEDAPSQNDPEYDAAEAEWAKGNHLDAIALMREYLSRNPREQYVAIRIAEIYEKDLSNPLAATLELEEVLTKGLSREKWGWTAIHLANLYSGSMNQPAKAMAILERVIAEYPETGAAKKARSRLGIPEEAAPAEEAVAETPPGTGADNPNLPRGFSSKKR
jgi:TolA-binding protein